MTDNRVKLDEDYRITEYEVDPSWKYNLSDRYHEYRRKWEKASNYTLYDFPLCIEIESSYHCNLNCIMCSRTKLELTEKNGLISRELYSKIVDEAKRYQMPAIMMDHEAEPLVNPDIADMVREASEAGIIDIWLHTNGNLLKLID